MTEHKAPSGAYFEDLQPGDVYEHAARRTVTETDNVWFSLITQNPQRMHIDRHYAEKTVFGRPLVNSCFTLALVTGQSVADISGCSHQLRAVTAPQVQAAARSGLVMRLAATLAHDEQVIFHVTLQLALEFHRLQLRAEHAAKAPFD